LFFVVKQLSGSMRITIMAAPESTSSPEARARVFVTTHWSVVLRARQKDSPDSQAARERLCRTYWPPLYSYLRRDGYSVEDAQDLTQEFLSRFLHREWLEHLHDQRGKFRSFLLTFLKHFLSDERDKAAAQKRGGGKKFVSLDDASMEERYLEPAQGLSPDQIFEHRWAETVLEQAVKRLRQEYTTLKRGALFDRLKDFQPGRHGALSYAEVGVQLGMTETAIKSAVHRFRLRHREILREEIAHTVVSPEEIDGEIQYLLTVLSR
jgi:RNA polymerase sigma-70 factor (ECF subfamily)